MMSIGQVGPAGKAGDYYTHQDNYYVLGSMDERWVGQGAEALGLSGKVDVKDFVAVLEGKLPDGSDLTRMVGGENKHRPGYDLTFMVRKLNRPLLGFLTMKRGKEEPHMVRPVAE